ncbi:MAG: bifunctional folylpolyglutamate synthase/dihydrofolate synthase [bacterium]
MRIKTYEDAMAYLNSFVNYETKGDRFYSEANWRLDRVEKLMELLGNPHLKYKTIHITGTKGKGSTATMVDFILREAGLKVGLYTSPHFVSWTERIRVGGERISVDELCGLIEDTKPRIEEMKRFPELGELTFFEVYTALGFEFFARKGVDVGVIEVGLGGRLDATNVVDPIVSVIAPIDFDHTQFLGNTLESIAREKVGIIKPGRPTITALQRPDVMKIIRERCFERGSSLVEVGGEIRFERTGGDSRGKRFRVEGLLGRYDDLYIPVLGDYQVSNAALALGAVELSGERISSEAVRRGLGKVKLPGRLQVVDGSPRIVLDGAHNPFSARALRQALEGDLSYRKLILVVGMFSDKDIRGIGKELCPIASNVIASKLAGNPRSAEPDLIRAEWRDLCGELDTVPDQRAAISMAKFLAGPDDLVCITGSIAFVGEAMKILNVEVD